MEVCPFRGIRYNAGIVGDLARVICPPYDVITSEQQKFYYERSDYNAIRLECASEQAGDTTTDDRYSRAAIAFQQWLKEGILRIDDSPAFYVHDHYFTYLGERRRRRGLIARVKLEPWGDGIYPHEETFSKAKRDRLQLMRSCQANFSPLFALYQDSEQKIALILHEASQDKPIMSLRVKRSNLPDSDDKHIIWAITDSRFQQQIKRSLSGQPLYIADGHHRYETALAYQQERAQVIASRSPERSEGTAKQSLTGKEAFNYVMMTLVDFSDPGLVILPVHRLVRGIAYSTLAGLENHLEDFFILESVPLTEGLFSSLELEMAGEVVLGILGLKPGFLVVLRQRQGISLEGVMPEKRSGVHRRLAVSLLNYIILDKMLELVQDSEDMAYTVDTTDAYQQIREGKYQLAFLVTSPSLTVLKTVVDAKDRMPRKSTYFYPKLPAGLIINSLSQL